MNENSEINRLFFSTASQWKIYPTPGKMDKLFYPTAALERAILQRFGLLIGRKGTGKTAFAQHLIDKSPSATRLINFGKFPFSDMKQNREEGIIDNFSFVNTWKTIILNAFIEFLAEAEGFDPLYERKLKKLLKIDPNLALEPAARRWNNLEFSLSALGVEGAVSGRRENYSELSLSEKVECLEEIVARATQRNIEFTLIFDELDLGFSFLGTEFSNSDYPSILSSLLRASYEINGRYSEGPVRLHTLVLIRDDIFDVLVDPDKNKWLDDAAKLEWTRTELKKMVEHLLSSSTGRSCDFEALFDRSIRQSKMVVGKGGKSHVRLSEYFFECTQRRPRDVIMFLREISSIALQEKKPTIDAFIIPESERKYSERLKQELVDEIHSVLPEISEIFDAISYSGRVRFKKEELMSLVGRAVGTIQKSDSQLLKILAILYYFSVIGVVGNANIIYKCERPGSRFIGQNNLELHPGLRMAINFNH
ncbi:P-loop ATPase, Sll1717 family [Rhodovulum sp. YEN HP10]|uniref:P-loop ATPase, Sll1717 family n=1 Tax=Rhodovulum sp. HP10 TaxID=3387397 RepID=UPI0039DF57CA